MGANETAAATLTRHMVILERHASTAAKKALDLLKGLEDRLVKRIKTFKSDAKTPPTMSQRRSIALLDQIRDAFGQTFMEIAEGFDEALVREARREVRFVNDLINEAIGVDFSTVQFSEKLLLDLVNNLDVEGKPAKEWWSKQSKRSFNTFKKRIRQDFAGGYTTDETIAWMKGTQKYKFKDGFMSPFKHQAEALARTAFNAVANDARMKTYAENEDILRGYVQVSQLDERTSDICEDYAGQEWDLNYKPIPPSTLPFQDGCPRHFNCRSVISPLLKTWNELQGDKSIAKKRGVDLDAAATGSSFEKFYKKRLAEKGFDQSEVKAIIKQRRLELNDTEIRRKSFNIRDEREADRAERQAKRKSK